MRPCDCKDMVDIESLDHSRLSYNEWSIRVHNGSSVMISNTSTDFKIPVKTFEKIAKWYLNPSKTTQTYYVDDHRVLIDNLLYVNTFNNTTLLKIPKIFFERFANWYFEDQDKKH